MTPWTNIGQNSGVSPWNSLGQNTGVSSLSLLQEIFPTQGSNTGLPQCRQILYQLTYKGNPRILEWVAYPFSSQSSKPRNWTGVSCIAGRFFTNWAIREGWNNTNYIFSWRCIWEVWNPNELKFRKWENIEDSMTEGEFFVWDGISRPHLWEVWVTVSSVFW